MQTFERVCSIVSQMMGLSPDFAFSEETTWQEIDADSLDLVEIVMSIEEAFEIEIDDEALYEMENLGDLVAFIDGK